MLLKNISFKMIISFFYAFLILDFWTFILLFTFIFSA